MTPLPLLDLPDQTQEELLRLHKQEAAAWLRGDRVTAITSRLLWCELYLAAGGTHAPSLPFLVSSVERMNEETMTVRQMWRLRIHTRPLVAITRRRRVTWKDNSGAPHYYFIEILACGHEQAVFYDLACENFAHRRRCGECGDARLAAIQENARVRPQHA